MLSRQPIEGTGRTSRVAGRRLTIAVILVGALVTPSAFRAAEGQAPDPAREAVMTPSAFARPDLVARYQASITAEELAAHLYLVSSDFFEGRATATRGQKLAAYYLASEYQKIGLAPMGQPTVESTNVLDRYLQPFPVYAERVKESRLEIKIGDTVVRTAFGPGISDGHSYLVSGSTATKEGTVVFAGYGISDAEYGYDDFRALGEAGVDYRSSWILILRDEPLASRDSSLFPTSDGGPS
ncbi:MAG: hypothetical protein R3282_07485, partial [Rhodothermales bacterium]|nr:hypothetical protein [Rhodothermales bacterium]